MPDQHTNQEDMLNKVSRRYLLRNSAIAATGAFLAPSFITGCTKIVTVIETKGWGVGNGPPLTTEQLKAAADNLNRMRAMMADLYQNVYNYDSVVFHALDSTTENGSWTNFVVDIIIDIIIGAASAGAILSGNPQVIPGLACLSAFLHDWGIGKDKPSDFPDLNGFFAGFQDGQLKMKQALDEKLGYLTDVTNNYANLQAGWKDPIVFNGKTYTLADLANSYFPDLTNHADEYYQLYNPMYDHQIKSVWNLAIMKCCSYYRHYAEDIWTDRTPKNVLLAWARGTFYPQNKGAYMRVLIGDEGPGGFEWQVYNYFLGIGGNEFPDAASAILFKDDTPGHIINNDGLFNRSYVFEQFSITKPVFEYGHELGTDEIGNYNPSADDWNFTGGFFPKLIK